MRQIITILSIGMMLIAPFISISAQAKIISSQSVFQEQLVNYDRQALLNSLNTSAVKEKLVSLGVNIKQAEHRIKNMTATEIATLNQKLDELPAAGGIVGIAITVLVVLVVLDLLGVTDVFTFINPIK